MKKVCSLFLFSVLTLLTSCAPTTEDDFPVVPTTNNPAVTNAQQQGLMPGIGY